MQDLPPGESFKVLSNHLNHREPGILLAKVDVGHTLTDTRIPSEGNIHLLGGSYLLVLLGMRGYDVSILLYYRDRNQVGNSSLVQPHAGSSI